MRHVTLGTPHEGSSLSVSALSDIRGIFHSNYGSEASDIGHFTMLSFHACLFCLYYENQRSIYHSTFQAVACESSKESPNLSLTYIIDPEEVLGARMPPTF